MDLPADWAAETVAVDGGDLQTYRVGDGPTVVVAHGFYDDARVWTPLVEALRDDHEVVAYDARAHGASDAPDSGYRVADRVADLRAVLDAFDLADPVLFGHSMGASTVASLAARHPSRPRAVALADPAEMLGTPDSTSEERAQFARQRVTEWQAQSVDAIAETYADEPGDYPTLLAEARTRCRPEIAEIARHGYPWAPELYGDVAAPTLILKADAEPAQRVDDHEVADELRRGRLVHVPGAGHAVVRDEFDAALRELRTFLLRI